MRDDFLRGDWAANHHRLTLSIHQFAARLVRDIRKTFDALTRQQFDAPWQHRRRQVRIERTH